MRPERQRKQHTAVVVPAAWSGDDPSREPTAQQRSYGVRSGGDGVGAAAAPPAASVAAVGCFLWSSFF